MLILTCKLGNEIINCYDGTRSKEQLKKWAAKKILLCPVCGKPYEYCHGKVKTPYFRHMDKTECEDLYSEPESEEHLNGKRILYEWIKKQKGVTNAVLEGWLPDTKQRPDVVFEYKGKQYVIEYQCSPIATEYIERHELYQAAGINDIWICGTEKYLKNNMREKFLQGQVQYFFDSSLCNFIYVNDYYYLLRYNREKVLPEKYHHGQSDFYGSNINNFIFKDGQVIHKTLKNLNEAVDKHKIRVKKEFEYKEKLQKEFEAKSKYILDKIRSDLFFDYSSYNICSVKRKNKNIYLYANDLIRVDKLNHYLDDLGAFSCSTWKIYINTKNGQYTLKAYPIVLSSSDYRYFHILCKSKTFDSKKLIYYSKNLESFKSDLIDLMKENRQYALDHYNPNERIMEVRESE